MAASDRTAQGRVIPSRSNGETPHPVARVGFVVSGLLGGLRLGAIQRRQHLPRARHHDLGEEPLDQVALAVSEMDRVTQQNASLVEESASAAAALEEQASMLSQLVAAFRLTTEPTVPTSVSTTVSSAPVIKTSKPTTSGRDDNW